MNEQLQVWISFLVAYEDISFLLWFWWPKIAKINQNKHTLKKKVEFDSNCDENNISLKGVKN